MLLIFRLCASGLRGLVYTEIEAVGAKTDLHSGMYGGAAPNPFFGLIEIISKLKDAKGKILIPGFYKNVKAPSKDELKAWKRLPFNQEHYRKTEVGSTVLTGEPGYSVMYRTWARPTLEVHGMPGGFVAPGAKTVIPAKASAKVSMRLVPNQNPDDILKRYKNYVKKLTPEGNPDQRQGLEQRPGLRGGHRQQVHQSRHRSDARRLQERDRIHPLRRFNSHRHRLPGRAEKFQA